MTLPINQIINGDCLEVMKSFPDKSVDLIVTDPPYGVSYKKTGETYMAGDTVNIIPYVLPEMRRILKDDGGIYMFSSTTKLTDIAPYFQMYFKLHSILIWDKIIGRIPRQLTHYKLRYEPIFYGSKGLHYLNSYQDDIIQCQIDRGNARIHPTQKPIAVCEYFIKNSTKENYLVLDPFAGSGTTLVAAKRLKRNYIGIELDGGYCEIAQKRLNEVTES